LLPGARGHIQVVKICFVLCFLKTTTKGMMKVISMERSEQIMRDDNDQEGNYNNGNEYMERNLISTISSGFSTFFSANMDSKRLQISDKKKSEVVTPLLSFSLLRFAPGFLGEKYRKQYEQKLTQHRRGRLINPWRLTG